MKVAIMQPYVFPYIGYFQLIQEVDIFVFYDDVNFIKGGWINRNNLLVNKQKHLFTFSLKNPSSFNLISETEICPKKIEKTTKKLIRTIEQSYKKAPFYDAIFPLISEFLLSFKGITISELAIDSVILISNYLNLNTTFKVSSKDFKDSKTIDDREQRLFKISKQLEATHYINPIGGLKLYKKANFNDQNIKLQFIESKVITYKQFDNEFVPWLSIIDILMFNDKDSVLEMLNDYQLI